jgi:type I restriction enzyme S subunit
MAGEWAETTTFADLIEKGALEIGDGYRARNEELGGDGLIFLRAGHVTDTHIDFSGVERFHAAAEPRVRSKLSRSGDAVVTTKGNCTGRTTFVTPSMPSFVYSPHLSYWRSKDPLRIESGFLRYWSKGNEFSQQLAGMMASTDMAPYLSLIDQKRLRISLPPIEAQRAIAHILGTLDDKIDLNRRMNETLEAMARALFESWFVQFGPVRTKVDGRDPDLPKPLADLFANSVEDSELGEIPKGWKVGCFGDIAARRSERVGDRKVVILSAVANGNLIKSDDHFTKRVYSKETSKYLVVEQWDFAYNPSRINIGSIGMLREGLLGAVSPVYVVVRPSPDYRWFLEFSVRSDQTKSWINALASGSVRQSLAYEDFASIPCVIPPPVIARAFNRIWATLSASINARVVESSTLATIRDSLLPKLISGEVRIESVKTASTLLDA